MNNHLSLKIGWLYPELMSTYGDRGNIVVFQKRASWRGIATTTVPIDQEVDMQTLKEIDLLFGGGSQDREQEIVMRDLKGKKGEIIKKLIENSLPALFVCGSPQLMGIYYEPAIGKRIDGLGIFNMVSTHPGIDKPRCIGNIVAKVQWQNLISSSGKEQDKKSIDSKVVNTHPDNIIVGFENHGGRTYLGKNTKPFAQVIKGFGNNGEDGTEGVVYKNAVGCYFHGPLLPKNPEIADFFIQRALEVKYKKPVTLAPLDDLLESKAKNALLTRFHISVPN